jgi:signal transduction histidine kinase
MEALAEPLRKHIIQVEPFTEWERPGGISGGITLGSGLMTEPVSSTSHGITARTVALESILEVTSNFLYVDNLDQLLERIVKTVSETFGVARCHIGIREEDTGLFAVRAAHGYEPGREAAIRKVKYTMDRMMHDLKPELKVGKNSYYVPSEMSEFPDEEGMLWIDHPERLEHARGFPDEWHELDYIDFLMYKKDGTLLGYLEIDEPDNHKVPGDEILRSIEIFSHLAAIAIQNAELFSKSERDRKAIGLLVDLIGHDINNYVQAVSGFVELAMSRPRVPEPSRKSLGKALDQIWNLKQLVTQVKLYAEVESAGSQDFKPIDLAPVIREAFKTVASSTPNRDVKLSMSDDKTAQYSNMNDLAKEVFINLFSNAVKFDEHDQVEIEVTIDNDSRDGRDLWCISVADHGPGIDDEIKESIFNRFTESALSTKGGSGLGLYITRTLVESYKGKVWVEDRVKGDSSKGSVFKVRLPKAT